MALVKPDPATGAFDIDIDTADYVYDRNRNTWTPCTRLHLAHGPATDTDTVITALSELIAAQHDSEPQP
ncbi:hypothetical protein [Nocardia sp. NPDC004860]|uniref:hypothetical protein n=1 Tax=Nocardia sp. NPDC004860 TaxID=3154557 RepID=UPI0033A01381